MSSLLCDEDLDYEKKRCPSDDDDNRQKKRCKANNVPASPWSSPDQTDDFNCKTTPALQDCSAVQDTGQTDKCIVDWFTVFDSDFYVSKDSKCGVEQSQYFCRLHSEFLYLLRDIQVSRDDTVPGACGSLRNGMPEYYATQAVEWHKQCRLFILDPITNAPIVDQKDKKLQYLLDFMISCVCLAVMCKLHQDDMNETTNIDYEHLAHLVAWFRENRCNDSSQALKRKMRLTDMFSFRGKEFYLGEIKQTLRRIEKLVLQAYNYSLYSIDDTHMALTRLDHSLEQACLAKRATKLQMAVFQMLRKRDNLCELFGKCMFDLYVKYGASNLGSVWLRTHIVLSILFYKWAPDDRVWLAFGPLCDDWSGYSSTNDLLAIIRGDHDIYDALKSEYLD